MAQFVGPVTSPEVKERRAKLYRQFIKRADEAIELKRKFNERKATREELEEAKKKVYDAFTRLQRHRNFYGLLTGHECDKMSGQAIYNKFFVYEYPDTENFDDDPDYYTPPDISSDEEWEDTYPTEDERRKAQKRAKDERKKDNDRKKRRRSISVAYTGKLKF